MKLLALCIVRSGNPIKRPPEGRSLRDAPSVNSTQKQYAFSAHKRYFVLQRLFSPHSFLARQKRMGRRRHPAPFRRIRNVPPEAVFHLEKCYFFGYGVFTPVRPSR